jgi:hypothetical protein
MGSMGARGLVVCCLWLGLVGLLSSQALVASPRDHPLPDPRSLATADPWSTVRGCLEVLGRCVDCSSDRVFTNILVAAPDAGNPWPSKKQIERRLWEWSKPDGRRGQCAVWTRRPGADEHIGEQSRLADLARDTNLRCSGFARAIQEDRWILLAIVDTPGP